jgi:DNA adenine methylase
VAERTDTLRRARAALARRAPVEKTIWGSPAGKKRIAERLAKLLPKHRVYVEPFVGSAAVLLAKEQSEVEVINDGDPEIAEAYKLVQKLTAEQLTQLRKLEWTGDEATFKRLLDAKPSSDVGRLHRFLYLTHFSYGKMRGRSFSPNVQGIEAQTIARIERDQPRLKGVKVYSGDYQKVVEKYDGPDTVMFLDPPYFGYDAGVGEGKFDEERFFGVLKAIKGKWLMTYGIRGKLPAMLKEAGFTIKRIRTPRTIGAMAGVGGPSVLTQLLVANYNFVEKSADAWLTDWDGTPAPDTFSATAAIVKAEVVGDERFVLGVVLEPEVVDSQGDIYSAAEVRRAAHRFMEEFGTLGLMHRMRVGNEAKVLESYLTPDNATIGETPVKKGTWMMAVRILSDALWADVQAGRLTGFSIGGSARRVPESGGASALPEGASVTES